MNLDQLFQEYDDLKSQAEYLQMEKTRLTTEAIPEEGRGLDSGVLQGPHLLGHQEAGRHDSADPSDCHRAKRGRALRHSAAGEMTRAEHYKRKAEAERRILTALAVGMLGLGLTAWGYIAVQIVMTWRW